MDDARYDDAGPLNPIDDDVLSHDDFPGIGSHPPSAAIWKLIQAVNSLAEPFTQSLRGEGIAFGNPNSSLQAKALRLKS